MKLSELQNNQTVRYRIGKHGEHSIYWQDWKDGQLYVQRRLEALPKRFWGRTNAPHVGDILTLTIRNEACAEFSQGDYQGNGVFNCEEWNLEIADLE